MGSDGLPVPALRIRGNLRERAATAFAEREARTSYVAAQRGHVPIYYTTRNALLALMDMVLGVDYVRIDGSSVVATVDDLTFTTFWRSLKRPGMDAEPGSSPAGDSYTIDHYSLVLVVPCAGCGGDIDVPVGTLADVGDVVMRGRAHLEVECVQRAQAKGKAVPT